MVLPGQFAEDAPESREVEATGFLGQGRMLISQVANPTAQMGIAAQLGEPAQFWEVGVEIGKKALDGDSIISMGTLKGVDSDFQNL
jgi:hypothetical protein